MGMDGADGNEKFLFTKELFPCWPCIESLARGCVPLAGLWMGVSGCCHYCAGQEFFKIYQPVYNGGWTRSGGGDPEKIGEFVMSYRFNPCCCCCAIPTPMKFYFMPSNM